MADSAVSDTQMLFVFCHKKGALIYAEDQGQDVLHQVKLMPKCQSNHRTRAANTTEEIGRQIFPCAYEDTGSFPREAFFLLLH